MNDTKLCGERVKLELSKVLMRVNLYIPMLKSRFTWFYFRAVKTNIAISVHLVAFDIEVSVARCLHQEVATDHAHGIVVVIDLAVDHVVVVAVADEVADVTM